MVIAIKLGISIDMLSYIMRCINDITITYPIIIKDLDLDNDEFTYTWYDPVTSTWKEPTSHQVLTEPNRVSKIC